MSAKQIIVFPRGQLSELDKARMEEAGWIAVEADEPSRVQRVANGRALEAKSLTGDAFVMAALTAISDAYDSTAKAFVRDLTRRMLASEKAKSAKAEGSQA